MPYSLFTPPESFLICSFKNTDLFVKKIYFSCPNILLGLAARRAAFAQFIKLGRTLLLSHPSRVLRPKRIPSFGDSGHLIQRALEASLARHAPVSGEEIPDNDPKNGLPTSQNTGSSYNLIRWRFLENGSELKNNVQVCCKNIFEPERGGGW